MTDITQAIKEYVVREFVPDVSVDELGTDYDLLASGVIDSIGLLRVISWLEQTFDVSLQDATPENLRTVEAMSALVAKAGRPVTAAQEQ